ncbi:MAG: hypothetical protein AB1505_11950 [Candidatus Latescibacterota bacterium]
MRAAGGRPTGAWACPAGRRPALGAGWWFLAIAWVCGMVLAACDRPPPTADYFSWTNPVTRRAVGLPEGWRQDPEAAREGETAVGYFTPTYARALNRYGHVTLHHEDLGQSAPMPLGSFVDRFVQYMRPRAAELSEPVFEEQDGLTQARLAVEAAHGDRQVVLRVRFWTADGVHVWYAVTESLLDDARFAERAAPLLERLQQSTLPAE